MDGFPLPDHNEYNRRSQTLERLWLSADEPHFYRQQRLSADAQNRRGFHRLYDTFVRQDDRVLRSQHPKD